VILFAQKGREGKFLTEGEGGNRYNDGTQQGFGKECDTSADVCLHSNLIHFSQYCAPQNLFGHQICQEALKDA
jgi:hypothetical protein